MRAALVVLMIAALFVGCGKSAAPAAQSGAELKSEQEAAAKKARESAVFGDQLKALDKAKETAEVATKAAEDRAKKADQ